MKSQIRRGNLMLSLAVCGLAAASHAGSFTDNFDVSRDFKTQGVVGTHWSGITSGTKTPAKVANWNANISSPGTLTITNASGGGGWRNTGDGPFLWTLVKGGGDFTNTVHVSDMSQANFNMSGLIVRDPSTASENYVMLALFAEFNLALVYRDTINDSDSDVSYTPPDHLDADKTTWVSWLRIVRQGGVISLSASKNNVDWEAVYTSARTDLTGDVEVGIMNSTYSDNPCWATFQNFSLTGPDINTAIRPAQATGLSLTPAVGSLNVSWTPGTGSAGSLVVVRRSNPITRQPVDGVVYSADAGLLSGSDLGESNFVAYADSGSSVTLTNLTATVPYTVGVYSYSGSGASTVYTLSNAPVATAAAFGTPTGISLSFASTNAVAVDDTIQAIVKVHFAGGAEVDATSSATFDASNTNLAAVSASGLITGLSGGVATITANYQTFSSTSNLTIVQLPVTDDFNAPKNYLAQGIAGTAWHGLLLGANDVTLGGVTLGPGRTLIADASETKTGRLTVESTDTGFDATEDDGFFLYRVIPGDFSVSVQVTSFNNLAYHMPGLMVRAPFELTSAENSLAIVNFDEFSIGNFVRAVINGIKAEVAQQSGAALPFLKIERQTNTFNFYQKLHALDPWTLIYTEERADLDGVPLQVGIVDQIFTANLGTAEFDNLTITGSTGSSTNAPSGPSQLILSSTVAGKVSANWTAGAGSSGSILIAHPETSVTRQPADGADYSATANADLNLGYDIGGSNIVLYAGTGNSVVASNLPPYHYTFAVYSYARVGGVNYYNILNPAIGGIDVAGIPVIDPNPPAAITRYSGKPISIVAGASPGTYVWQKNGTNVVNGGPISGATTPTLNISDSQAADSGSYALIASTVVGSTTSSPTVLTILSPTNAAELSVLANNPSAFWRMEESSGTTAFDYAGGYDGTHGAADTVGVPGPSASDGFAQFGAGNLAAQFPGNASSTALAIPGLTSGSETVSAMTITAWIKLAAFPPDRAGMVTFTAPADTGFRVYNGANGLSILWNNTVAHSGIIPPVGQWAFVAMVVSPDGGKIYMATNGAWQVYSDSASRVPISISGGGYIGSDRAIADRYFEGVIDEVAVYPAALSGSAITNLYQGVVPPPGVTINIQRIGSSIQLSWPQGTLLESTNVTGPWTTNGAPSPLIIPNPADTKFYRVIVR